LTVGAGTAGTLAGLWLGLWLGVDTGKTVMETPAPAVRQSDGSLVLQRVPDATAKPKQIIPSGGTVERIVQVTVQPRPIVPTLTKGDLSPDLPVSGPPITVDMTLVGMPDGSKRVVVSSPDGTATGGIDIPVTPIRTVDKSHEVGLIYGVKSIGGYYQRNYGKVTVGADVRRIYSGLDVKGWDASLRLGFRW
jgi:hypothetical protein